MSSGAPVTLFAMNQKGWQVLQAIVQHGGAACVRQVIGARDAQLQEDYFHAIAAFCATHHIAFVERRQAPTHIDGYSFAVGWRWLIRGANQLIVFHDALLPKYRGFAPLVTSLMQREPQLGVTALYAAEQYDRGPIIAQRRINVDYPLKIAAAIDLITPLYVALSLEVLQQLLRGEHPAAQPQDDSQASYSLWRDAADYHINWQQSAVAVQAQVDALGTPYLGASTYVGTRLARLREVSVRPDVCIPQRQVGKVIFMEQGRPTVVCGRGLLRLEQLHCAKSGVNLLPLRQFRTRFQ